MKIAIKKCASVCIEWAMKGMVFSLLVLVVLNIFANNLFLEFASVLLHGIYISSHAIWIFSGGAR